MVHSYRKGYMAERELVHKLAKLGYMTIRTPRSGRINLPSPDVIAAKNGKLIVIECKARNAAFSITPEQLDELTQWENVAGAIPYIAWRLPRKEWSFLHLKDVIENNGNVGKKFAQENGIKIDAI